jgi:citrate-Mg2+:H+ or citrate-Ca2+:H+ symporter, CitMHS family
MLAATGFLTIAAFLAAVLSQRVSVFIALTVLPILAAVVVGQGGRLGELVLAGFETVAPVAIMITFAVSWSTRGSSTRRCAAWCGGRAGTR